MQEDTKVEETKADETKTEQTKTEQTKPADTTPQKQKKAAAHAPKVTIKPVQSEPPLVKFSRSTMLEQEAGRRALEKRKEG